MFRDYVLVRSRCSEVLFNEIVRKVVLFLIKLKRTACYFIKKGTTGQLFSCKFCNFFRTAFIEEVVWRYSVKKSVFAKFCKIHRKTSVPESFNRPATLFKKRLWHRCFPVNFAKFLRTLCLDRTPPAVASVLNRAS